MKNNKVKYLDANVILRYIIKDNLEQLSLVNKLLKEAKNGNIKLFCSVITLFEVQWVLKSVYNLEKNDICEILLNLMVISINFENEEILMNSVEEMKNNNLGFEDNYHIQFSKKNNFELVSFDKKLNNQNKKLN